MNIPRLAKTLPVAALLGVLLVGKSLASTHVWIAIGDPCSRPFAGSSFSTDLIISSWNGAVGALDVTVYYDPDVLHLITFSPSSDSPFHPNCFARQSSNSSGEVRIVCFQTEDRETWETPLSLGTLAWEVVDSAISETQVKIQATVIVHVNWQPVEVMTYGQRIVIATETLYLPLILRE